MGKISPVPATNPGPAAPPPKLRNEQVWSARDAHANKNCTIRYLAERYRVSVVTMRDAVFGRNAYKDV
jgi:hypothetical protein